LKAVICGTYPKKGRPNHMFDSKADISLNIPKPKFKNLSELINLSLELFFKSFWFITIVVLLPYVPLVFFGTLFLNLNDFPIHNTFIFLIIFYSFSSLTYPAIIFGIAHYIKYKKLPKTLDAYHFAWHKWGQVLVRSTAALLITLFGYVLLFVPGILASIAYSLLPAVVCFEGNTFKDSIRRSRELSVGNRKIIFFSASVLAILAFIVELITKGFSYLIDHFFHFGLIAQYSEIVIHFLSTVMGNLSLIALLLIYLKTVKERKKKPKEMWLLRWAR
jgi:hypothetical protein